MHLASVDVLRQNVIRAHRSGQELVHVAEAKAVQRAPEFLVQDIGRFQDIVRELSVHDPAPTSTPRQHGPPVAGY